MSSSKLVWFLFLSISYFISQTVSILDFQRGNPNRREEICDEITNDSNYNEDAYDDYDENLEDDQNTSSIRSQSQQKRRQLSEKEDIITGQVLETFNGQVPEVSCSPGYYRPPGGTNMKKVTGQRSDGCVKCPKGRYGSTSGLISSACSGLCSLGTYGDRRGLKSKNDCALCPTGRYGSTTGLTSKQCTGACPLGKYSITPGLITINDCKACPAGYRMHGCPWAIQPRSGQDQDHQHNEYIGFGIEASFKDPIPYKTDKI